MENKYQITKTIRFGLTKKRAGKKFLSHERLDEYLKISEAKIKENIRNEAKLDEKGFVEKTKKCFEQIKKYMNNWNKVYFRGDQIFLTKDYYKIIAKKAKFNWFWKDKRNIKQPQAQMIKISSLSIQYYDKPRKEYIEQYWKENLAKTERLLNEFKPLLEQYEIALNSADKAHKKPHLVDFRKVFLSLCNLVYDTLIPLNNYSIVFSGIDKLSDDEKNKNIKEFASPEQEKEREIFFENIRELKDYFESKGGYVPFGRVTLNKYTADQKPHDFFKEIQNSSDKKSVKLKNFLEQLAALIQKLQKEPDIQKYFSLQDNKIKKVKEDDHLSVVERVQMFKCKAIPPSVIYPLSDYLQKQYGLTDTQPILQAIGKPVSPAYDFSELTNEEDKKNFDLNNYPLKYAFDYAWENLARSKYRSVNFPKEKCREFLKKFDIDDNNKNFKLYADLLFISENIATLEYGNPNNIPGIISEIEKIIFARTPDKQEIEEAEKEKNRLTTEIRNLEKNKDSKEKKRIKKENKGLYNRLNEIKQFLSLSKNLPIFSAAETLDYLSKSKKEKEKTRKSHENSSYTEFLAAKQKIGLIRGEQKSKVTSYRKLTNTIDGFGKIASEFGKTFGELRDKFREENEINKINFCGIIIEDEKGDRYLLLQKINREEKIKENNNDINIFDINEGDLKTYQVKSLTSKTLNKLIKNKGAYKDFHSLEGIDIKQSKENWTNYQNKDEFISALKNALTESKMAKDQKWDEFGWDFSKYNTYDEISKEVDRKGYNFAEGKISEEKIKDLVNNKGCLLLPIINQDITSKNRIPKNQFSKDWQMIFEKDNKEYCLHPEFKMVYRMPTPDYPKAEEKRYSRFQMIANMQCEIIPQIKDFVSNREQIIRFNNEEKQREYVEIFSNNISFDDDFYVIGIDRGIKQLATLCVLNSKGEIQGDFEIYTRKFDDEKKEWKHTLLRKDNILDLSNLRVETTVENKKVLVDLLSIKVYDKGKDKKGEPTKENKQSRKLKELSYIRKLQYRMQYEEERVKIFIDKYTKDGEIHLDENNIEELNISSYKEGKKFADLPIQDMKDMLKKFKEYRDKNLKEEKRKLCELDAADKLKSGIVANMVGVVVYFLEKYNYKAFISLENLCRAYRQATDGMTGQTISSTHQDPEIDFKEQENLVLAGVGTYQFFEMQLLKKLFKMQRDEKIINLVPAFRSVSNYEQIVKRIQKEDEDEYTNYPFGIVEFVDPRNTSQCCPWCNEKSKENFSRKKGKNRNSLFCEKCKFSTVEGETKQSDKYNERKSLKLDYIIDGDQNGAYHIAFKTLKNKKKQQKRQKKQNK